MDRERHEGHKGTVFMVSDQPLLLPAFTKFADASRIEGRLAKVTKNWAGSRSQP